MIKGIKVMLIPNNKQQTKLFQYAGAKRFAYNWALARQQENYDNGGKFIADNELRKEFTQFKKLQGNEWLSNISNNVTKQAIKDCCNSFQRFFKGLAKYPKFKSRKHDEPKFYQDTSKIQFTSTHVKLEGFASSKKKNKQKLNWVKLAEKNRIPFDENVKYINPRVSYDGIHWFVSVGIEYPDIEEKPFNDGIGIDLGIKDLAICSDGTTYKNINKTQRSIKKTLKRKQRKVSRKYEMNKNDKKDDKKDDKKFVKTKNIIKLEKEINIIHKKISGIRNNYLHQTTSEIIKREPSYIVIEDLNISGMIKNRHLSKAIQEQCLREFRRQLEYKSFKNNIELRIVGKWYPSSKTCHDCGYIKKDLNLSDRVYVCESCGLVIDRDYNASLNLRDCKEYKVYTPKVKEQS